MWKTGHSLIKSKMKETGAPLAGEMSGHIFFATIITASTTRSTPRSG
jgi:phosphomannomutase